MNWVVANPENRRDWSINTCICSMWVNMARHPFASSYGPKYTELTMPNAQSQVLGAFDTLPKKKEKRKEKKRHCGNPFSSQRQSRRLHWPCLHSHNCSIDKQKGTIRWHSIGVARTLWSIGFWNRRRMHRTCNYYSIVFLLPVFTQPKAYYDIISIHWRDVNHIIGENYAKKRLHKFPAQLEMSATRILGSPKKCATMFNSSTTYDDGIGFLLRNGLFFVFFFF